MNEIPGKTSSLRALENHPQVTEWESLFTERVKKIMILQMFFLTVARAFYFHQMNHVSVCCCCFRGTCKGLS